MEEHQNVPNDSVQQSEAVYNADTSLSDNAANIMQPCRTSPTQSFTQDIHMLLEEMTDLRHDFETKVQYDESKECLIQSLHRELQEYREGLHFRILKPICVDLIAIYDDLGKLSETLSQEGSELSQNLTHHLVLYQEAIEETLRRNDVDAFVSEEDIFLPARQRMLLVIPVNEPALDRHIARRVRKGFESGNRLLRPELVEIYKYSTASDT